MSDILFLCIVLHLNSGKNGNVSEMRVREREEDGERNSIEN
jgi:hypothetical protein